MDTNEQLLRLTETCTRTDEKVSELVDRFDRLIPYVGELEKRTKSLELSRSWISGVGSVAAIIWTGLLALISMWIGHHK